MAVGGAYSFLVAAVIASAVAPTAAANAYFMPKRLLAGAAPPAVTAGAGADAEASGQVEG